MTKSDAQVRLHEFLVQNGQALDAYGSAEFALRKEAALQFLDLLAQTGSEPLGIERWKYVDGEFEIDTLGGWYCEGTDPDRNLAAAREFILHAQGCAEDSFTIQFD